MSGANERAPGSVFISYRRDETLAYAHLLHYKLREQFPDAPVFLDTYSIEPGADYVKEIQQAVTTCAVMIVLIGPKWVRIVDDDGQPRLDDSSDLVRLEIEVALERGTRVIPVLVDGAAVPQSWELPGSIAALRRRNALEIGVHSFDHDMRRLLDGIARALRGAETNNGTTSSEPASTTTSEQKASTSDDGKHHERQEIADRAVTITRVGDVTRWQYRWPGNAVEKYHTTTEYIVADDHGQLHVLVAETTRAAYGRDRGRTIVFGNVGGAPSGYYPWTEFVETDDDGYYAARLNNPADPGKTLRDGDPIPPRFTGSIIRRNDAVFRSIRQGPALRLIVKRTDADAMIRHAYWSASLRQLV